MQMDRIHASNFQHARVTYLQSIIVHQQSAAFHLRQATCHFHWPLLSASRYSLRWRGGGPIGRDERT